MSKETKNNAADKGSGKKWLALMNKKKKLKIVLEKYGRL